MRFFFFYFNVNTVFIWYFLSFALREYYSQQGFSSFYDYIFYLFRASKSPIKIFLHHHHHQVGVFERKLSCSTWVITHAQSLSLSLSRTSCTRLVHAHAAGVSVSVGCTARAAFGCQPESNWIIKSCFFPCKFAVFSRGVLRRIFPTGRTPSLR